MNAQTASAFILLSMGATVANAQQIVTNDRVANSMPTQYQPAACKIKPNHFASVLMRQSADECDEQDTQR